MKPTVVLISGSTREGSRHSKAVALAAEAAPESVQAVIFEELTKTEQFVPGDAARDSAPVIEKFLTLLKQADAVVIAAPEYAGGLPGSLKNVLDWTVGEGELYEKPVAWIETAPQGRGEGAREQLRVVLNYVGARAIEDACIRLDPATDNNEVMQRFWSAIIAVIG